MKDTITLAMNAFSVITCVHDNSWIYSSAQEVGDLRGIRLDPDLRKNTYKLGFSNSFSIKPQDLQFIVN